MKLVKRLDELINPETFAFERGADYGKGAPRKGTEITTSKTTDTLDKMVRTYPDPNSGMSTAMNTYLGEDSITKKTKRESDVIARQSDDKGDFKVSGAIQKTIRTLVRDINGLEPDERPAAVEMLDALLNKK